MSFWKGIVFNAIWGLFWVLMQEGLTAQAQSAVSHPKPEDLRIAQASQSAASDFYKKAEVTIGEMKKDPNYYTLYRIVERLARSNGLDKSPWRVHISPEYDINAYATQVNLLVLYNGLLDLVSGDNNAIACAVGHEMAHHAQNHIPVGVAQKQKILQQLRTEAVQEVTAEQQDLREDLKKMDTSRWITGQAASLGGLIRGAGGLPGVIGGLINSAIQGQRQRRLEDAVKRIEQISAAKEAKVRKDWSELDHRHEFEADALGYQYLVRAGFKPEGCLTLMNVLNRLPGSQIPGETHPAPADRMAAIKALSSRYPTATLVAEGNKYRAASPKPLTFGPSTDKNQSLRIDSKAGSSKGDFPE